jgi:hypothetical protein
VAQRFKRCGKCIALNPALAAAGTAYAQKRQRRVFRKLFRRAASAALGKRLQALRWKILSHEGVKTMQWEYFDRMVVFSESEEGMVSGLDSWINDAGADGWELVSSVPLIAPNKDGVAYGTIGIHMVFKRPHEEPPKA